MKTVFVLRQLFTNLWRERTPVLATILTISIAIIILVTLCEAGFRIYDELNRLKRDLAIEIYVSPNLSEDETESVSRKLNKFQSIESMRYISKEKAADIFESEFGEDIYDILEENPLPASFEIKLKEEFNHESYLYLFKKQVSDINGVDEIHYRHTVLENLENIMEMVVII